MNGGKGGAARVGQPVPARFAEAVLAEQIAFIYRTIGSQVVVNPVMGLLIVGLLADLYPLSSLLIWASGLILVAVMRALAWRAYIRRRDRAMSMRRSQFWGRLFAWVSVLNGVVWGSLVYFFFSPTHFVESMVLVIAIAGFTAGSFSAYSAYLPAYVGFAVPAVGLVALRLMSEGGGAYGVLTAMCVLFVLVLLAYARSGQDQIRAAIVAQLEMTELNAALVHQQAALTQAKEAAEAANRAKSKFLASASHDLRQPMHALRLFVDLLATRNTQGETVPVIDKITTTVDALEELFSKLLELAQADLGRVQVDLQAVPLNRILRQIDVEHGPVAEAKGIRLRVRPTEAVTHSDPVLLERILRNIVTNAIRYTHQGGILVACRRHGTALRIEVWDTGIGISETDQVRIFEEFHQVENPERDRTKGLGLGLAIVDKLSQLLGIRVALRSRPGRGSCFSLILPRVPTDTCLPRLLPESVPVATGTLEDLVVVLVEDETEILQATRDLLLRWGCCVIPAASLAEAESTLVQSGVLPQLVITDYRLRDGATGDEVIAAMRGRTRPDLPAIVLTGDTLLKRPMATSDNAGTGVPLVLYKPLRPARLRAAIEHLLAQHASTCIDRQFGDNRDLPFSNLSSWR